MLMLKRIIKNDCYTAVLDRHPIMTLLCKAHGAPFYTIVQKRCCALGIKLSCCLVVVLS